MHPYNEILEELRKGKLSSLYVGKTHLENSQRRTDTQHASLLREIEQQTQSCNFQLSIECNSPDFGNESKEALLSLLRCNRAIDLSVIGNGSTENSSSTKEGDLIASIAEALRLRDDTKSGRVELSFSWITLGKKAVDALAKVFLNPNLITALSFFHCKLLDTGISPLLVAFRQNPRTRLILLRLRLDVVTPLVSSDVVELLTFLASKPRLLNLSFGIDALTDQAINDVVLAIQENPYLTRLTPDRLWGVRPGLLSLAAITKLLRYNPILEEMGLKSTIKKLTLEQKMTVLEALLQNPNPPPIGADVVMQLMQERYKGLLTGLSDRTEGALKELEPEAVNWTARQEPYRGSLAAHEPDGADWANRAADKIVRAVEYNVLLERALTHSLKGKQALTLEFSGTTPLAGMGAVLDAILANPHLNITFYWWMPLSEEMVARIARFFRFSENRIERVGFLNSDGRRTNSSTSIAPIFNAIRDNPNVNVLELCLHYDVNFLESTAIREGFQALTSLLAVNKTIGRISTSEWKVTDAQMTSLCRALKNNPGTAIQSFGSVDWTTLGKEGIEALTRLLLFHNKTIIELEDFAEDVRCFDENLIIQTCLERNRRYLHSWAQVAVVVGCYRTNLPAAASVSRKPSICASVIPLLPEILKMADITIPEKKQNTDKQAKVAAVAANAVGSSATGAMATASAAGSSSAAAAANAAGSSATGIAAAAAANGAGSSATGVAAAAAANAAGSSATGAAAAANAARSSSAAAAAATASAARVEPDPTAFRAAETQIQTLLALQKAFSTLRAVARVHAIRDEEGIPEAPDDGFGGSELPIWTPTEIRSRVAEAQNQVCAALQSECDRRLRTGDRSRADARLETVVRFNVDKFIDTGYFRSVSLGSSTPQGNLVSGNPLNGAEGGSVPNRAERNGQLTIPRKIGRRRSI